MGNISEADYPPLIRNTNSFYDGKPKPILPPPYTLAMIKDFVPQVITGKAYFLRPPGGYQVYMEHNEALKRQGKPKIEEILEEMKWNPLALLRNRYPYDVAHNVCHAVLWMHGSSEKDAKLFFETTMRALGIPPNNVVWYQNPPSLVSMPEIEHVQVFIESSEPPALPQFGTIFQRRFN